MGYFKTANITVKMTDWRHIGDCAHACYIMDNEKMNSLHRYQCTNLFPELASSTRLSFFSSNKQE